MNINSPDAVITLQRNVKENNHKSRKRIGFHVYVLCYIEDFNKLNYDERCTMLMDELGIALGHCLMSQDNDDYDSTDSDLYDENKIKYLSKFRLACNNWRKILVEMRNAWNVRARHLNALLVPGKMLVVPQCIGGNNHDHYERTVLDSLSLDWAKIFKLFQSALHRVPNENSTTEVIFGNEKVSLGSQVFCRFKLPALLRLTLFGGDEYRNIKNYEIIKKNK